MKLSFMMRWLPILLALLLLLILDEVGAESSFDAAAAAEDALHHGLLRRNLLQAVSDGGEDDIISGQDLKEEITETPKKAKKAPAFAFGEDKLGPLLFYDGTSNAFLMEVESPIRVTVFGEDGKELTVVELADPAKTVKGSMVDADRTNFQVNLDWKEHEFGDRLKVSGFQINMQFAKTGSKEFALAKLEVVRSTIDRIAMRPQSLDVATSHGYKVKAPLGLAFACEDPGTFMPARSANDDGNKNKYRIGLTLPGVKLQVFEIGRGFGPSWSCADLLPISVWVGLIVSLLLASVCYYGFSMLANIHTMDRFDDPKGKTIHVPQTD